MNHKINLSQGMEHVDVWNVIRSNTCIIVEWNSESRQLAAPPIPPAVVSRVQDWRSIACSYLGVCGGVTLENFDVFPSQRLILQAFTRAHTLWTIHVKSNSLGTEVDYLGLCPDRPRCSMCSYARLCPPDVQHELSKLIIIMGWVQGGFGEYCMIRNIQTRLANSMEQRQMLPATLMILYLVLASCHGEFIYRILPALSCILQSLIGFFDAAKAAQVDVLCWRVVRRCIQCVSSFLLTNVFCHEVVCFWFASLHALAWGKLF